MPLSLHPDTVRSSRHPNVALAPCAASFPAYHERTASPNGMRREAVCACGAMFFQVCKRAFGCRSEIGLRFASTFEELDALPPLKLSRRAGRGQKRAKGRIILAIHRNRPRSLRHSRSHFGFRPHPRPLPQEQGRGDETAFVSLPLFLGVVQAVPTRVGIDSLCSGLGRGPQ
jgi:hypothetical protein